MNLGYYTKQLNKLLVTGLLLIYLPNGHAASSDDMSSTKQGAISIDAQSKQSEVKLMKLDAALAETPIDIRRVWLAFKHYQENPAISRQEKLEYLWTLGQRYQHDETRFSLVLEFLQSMKPLELAPQLIASYQQTSDRKIKIQLLFVLSDALRLPQQTLNANDQKNVLLIQNFYSDTIQHTNDPVIFYRLIGLYVNTVPASQAYQTIREGYAHLSEKKIDPQKRVVYAGKYYLALFRAAFETEGSQNTLLKELLKEGATLKGEQHQAYAFALCAALNRKSPAKIDDTIKPVLKSALIQNRPLLLSGRYDEKLRKLPNCNWLDAYGNVIAMDDAKKMAALISYICTSKDLTLQAELVPLFTRAPLPYNNIKHLDPSCAKQISTKINQRLAMLHGENSKEADILRLAASTLSPLTN